MIRGIGSRENSVGAVVVLYPEIAVPIIGILRVYPFSLRVCLVDLFRKLFRLLIEIHLFIETAQLRAVTSL